MARARSGVISARNKIGTIYDATTGSVAGSGITDVAIQNYATKAFSKGSDAVLSRTVPLTLPPCTASWGCKPYLHSPGGLGNCT